MAKCPICYTTLSSGASGWTDDPLKTPLHFIPSLRGNQIIRAPHILELQERVNERESGFSGYTPTLWTPVVARRFAARPQYINELREAVEGMLVHIEYDLSDYLSQDENGESDGSITDWLDGHRLSKYGMVRGMHIEELRMPINVPDLTVTNITLTNLGVSGGRGIYDIAYTVKNIGFRKASVNVGRLALTAGDYIDSEIIELGPVDNTISLPSETVIHTTWYYRPTGTPEAFTMTATADINKTVTELNEFNNELIVNFVDRLPENSNVPDLTVTDITITDLGIIDGNGTYDIAYKVKNIGLGASAACTGLLRLAIEPAHIVVHAYNPEGVEISGIQNFINSAMAYYDDIPLGPTGSTVYTLPQGRHIIKVIFNGMTMIQEVDFSGEATVPVDFTFVRTEFNFVSYMNGWDINRHLENTFVGPSNNDFMSVPTGGHTWGPSPIIDHTLDSNPRDFAISGFLASTVLFNGTHFNVDLYSELAWNCPGTNDFIVVSKAELVSGSAYIVLSPPSLPPVVDFTNWIFQCTLDGWMAGLAVLYEGQSQPTWILPNPVNTPFIHVNEKLSRSISTTVPILEWKISLVYSVFDMVAQSLAVSFYGDPRSGTKNASNIRAGTLGGLKFSSVPYDW
jgi:hypothetical protein